MLLLPFIWKNAFMFIFHCFLIVILENHAPFSLNFSSPVTYSSKESQHSPLPSAPSPKQNEIPLKTSVHFPITITICKHWSKFVTCCPSPRDCCRGVNHPQIHSYYGFRLCWRKWLSQILIRWLWEKNERGRGPRCPPIFWSLKKGTRTFHFC